MALTTMMVAATAVCFAASGKALDSEEAIAEQFANGAFYKKMSPLMTAEMQSKMPELEYIEIQKKMAQELGKFNVFRMRQFTRFDDVDLLTYELRTEKIPVAQFKFVFKVAGDKALLDDAYLELPNPKEEAAPKK